MIRISSTLAVLALLGTAAAADDGGKIAAERHFACNYNAARALAVRKGNDHVPADVLARKARAMCADEEETLGRELGARAMFKARREMERTNKSIIEADRRGTFWAPNPQAERTGRELVPGCAAIACGMMPTWDDRLKIWRPYPSGR